MTDTIKLATGVLLPPQHNQVVLAKALATLGRFAGGRLMLGIGSAGCARRPRLLACPSKAAAPAPRSSHRRSPTA